ncbi:outer membrane beta-barrel protein [Mesonia sp. K7]|uniref:outer membrane beta-barrel protein n=1 Tax=Mesonia sp. K7 TaxID=2218606 RepID=UPI000DA98235|nr:outer membrane beta-barrel protein [Mesonia sp. K7]PZD78700.1 TonB-dependent receptor [Mesonia sp. K7]
MKKFHLLQWFAVLFFTATSFAQDYKITGKISDESQIALESATVYVETKDSTLVDYTITDRNGNFTVEGKTSENLVNLFVSYTGFQTLKKEIDFSQSKTVELGNLNLVIDDNTLDEVVVKGTRAPVTIKTDTLEFNAASFKTKDDANLEEVLKKLPGVKVDTEGKITVNGKPVSRILVNGKEFFGDDPLVATKNLPKEIINKIQVVDTKTKSQEFTGEEGDSENKTINITIEEDKNKGFFSRLTAGAGTNERYELSGIANYFKDEMRVSLLASSNNINSSGFSFDEVFDAMGRNAYSITRNSSGAFSINGNSFGGGSGVTKSDNAGFNFTNEWNDNTELDVNYFFNRADNVTETKIERENILPDRRYFNNSESGSNRENDNHRLRLGFEVELDTLTRIDFRPNITYNDGFSNSDSFTESFEEDGTPINDAETFRDSEVNSLNFSNRLDVTRKIGKRKSFLRLGFNNSHNNSDEEEFLFSNRRTYSNGVLEDEEIQDQFITEEGRQDTYEIEFDSRFSLTDSLQLEFDYMYTKENRHNSRLVYDKDLTSEGYDNLNNNLSSEFYSETFEHRPSVGLSYTGKKLRLGTNAGIQNIRLVNENVFADAEFDNTFTNFYSRVFAHYRINQTKSMYANYRSNWNVPSISQLQPVQNTTNPLNIVTGNPNLRPTLNHNLYANFNNYDFKSKSGFYSYLGGSFYQDQVVSITTTDEDLVRTTTYTNVDGAYNFYGGFSIDRSFKFKDESTFRLSPGINANYSKNVGFSNAVQFDSKNLSLTPNIGFQYDIPDKITIEPNYDFSFNQTNYSLNDRTEEFINHTVTTEITSYWPKNFVFGNDITYQYLGNVAPGFKNNYVLWNMSLGYKVFGEDGIIKVKVFDVLNENTGVVRRTGEDYIQDQESLVLEQYVMFSFTYKLSKFAGNKSPRGGMRFRRM